MGRGVSEVRIGHVASLGPSRHVSGLGDTASKSPGSRGFLMTNARPARESASPA